MDRKLIAAIACVLVLLSLAGCGKEDEGVTVVSPPENSGIDGATVVQTTETSDQQPKQAVPTGTEDYCSDSDGGMKSEQQGITRGISAGEAFRETDICFDSKTLVEMYCEGTKIAMKYMKCAGECVYGECN
jgi:hypothetical protein